MNERKIRNRVIIEQTSDGIRGSVTLNEDVVAMIAGLVTGDLDGIQSVDKSSPFDVKSEQPKKGTAKKVGEIKAAFDVYIVMEYGKDLVKVARELREKIDSKVKRMAGREVVEIDINMLDIQLPGETKLQSLRVR